MDQKRADLEGLRGLAVSLVVCSHAAPSLLPGGFVGVDVFFVISGFLLSRSLRRIDASSSSSSSSSSIYSFFVRRAWRLVPSSCVVLLSVLCVSRFLLVPSMFTRVSHDAFAASLQAANLLFATRSTDYFADSDSPLLHLWSLSLEWQFVLIAPWLLSFLRKSSRFVCWALIACSVASAHLVLVDVAYFLPSARLAEFLIGVVAAESEQCLSAWMSAAALCVLVGCAFTFSALLPFFPGVMALLPCAATAVILSADENGFVNQLLARSLKWAGTVSYSAYLVHYPVLFFFHRGFMDVWMALFFGFGGTLVLFFAVERPLRGCKHQMLAALLFVPAALVLLLMFLFSSPSVSLASNPRLAVVAADAQANFSSASFGVGVDCRKNIRTVCMDVCAAQQRCQDRSIRCISNATQCMFGAVGDGGMLLLGDSHAAQHVPMFEEFGALRVFNWQFNAVPPLLFGTGFAVLQKRRMFFGGDIFFARARDLLVPHFSVIALGGMWNQYTRFYPNFLDLLRETVDELLKLNKTVVLLGQVPAFEGFPNSHENDGCPLWLPPKDQRNELKFRSCFVETTMKLLHSRFPAFVNDRLRGWARRERSGRLIYHDVNDHICSKSGTCSPYFMDGLRSYVHSEHISYGAGRLLGKRIMEKIGVPMSVQKMAKAAKQIQPGFNPNTLNYYSFVE